MIHTITLRGCRVHNLKNISLEIPKYCITVLTGVSGSGKTSLAFDTLFAEGQRRYLEYLSPQLRSHVKQLPKPDADLIEGLSPTLAVEQGRSYLSPRGTVALYTDIYDFLILLYVHLGEQHSPVTGKRLYRYTRQEMTDTVLANYAIGSRLQLLAPIQFYDFESTLQRLQQSGFIRLQINNQEWVSGDPLPALTSSTSINVVVDRLEIKESIRDRLSQSIETALDLSQGILYVQEGRSGPKRSFTEIYVCPETGIAFPPLGLSDFNFNSPHGACPVCKGKGSQAQAIPHLILWKEDEPLTPQIYSYLKQFPPKMALEAIWQSLLQAMNYQEELFIQDLSADFKEAILYGSPLELTWSVQINQKMHLLKGHWKGLIPLINEALQDANLNTRLIAAPFVTWNVCPACQGKRLKPEALACLLKGKNIAELCDLNVEQLLALLETWTFDPPNDFIAEEPLKQIKMRLNFLQQVGLGYLELNRSSSTLSDGELQRIQLAAHIGAKLSGLIYVLDEPSLGLHRQDIHYLFKVIEELKNIGNTIVIVEHERYLIEKADHIIELGPGAGIHGGHITFTGSYSQMLQDPQSMTGEWLSGRVTYSKKSPRPISKSKLTISHAHLHNLQDFSVTIPLGCLVGFCGVSGSGKSTLVLDIIGKEIDKMLHFSYQSPFIKGAEPIQRLVTNQKIHERFSSRAILATYTGLMTPLRQLFAETKLAKARGYTAARFSINKKGGRCEACEGLGYQRLSMQWMPDVLVPCDVCNGLRYNYETLQVTWEGKSIADVLSLSVEEAAHIFRYIPHLSFKLELMQDLGLNYLALGQSFRTLSSGEIQRLRLVSDLASPSKETTLYLLDEPSAGLHFQDISKLLRILHRLVEQGHSIFMIEHHLDLLQQADWLIELGPEGGPKGGQLLFTGPPKKISETDTPTGRIFNKS